MKKINVKVNSITLDLNGTIMSNVRSTINHPEAYIDSREGYYKFMYQEKNGEWNYSFCTKSKKEMYVYMKGLLNFR